MSARPMPASEPRRPACGTTRWAHWPMKEKTSLKVPIMTIYKGVTPFVVADLVKLVLLVAFPVIATYLVSTMQH